MEPQPTRHTASFKTANNVAPPASSGAPRLTTILGAWLESSVHELLYVRSIYPRKSFAPTRYCGIACHASRHPDVVDYIFDTLSVAVPALVSGVADELSLVIVDARGESGENVERVVERFAFSFDVREMTVVAEALEKEDDSVRAGRLVRDLERGLKDVLLRIIIMDGVDMGTRRGRLSSTTSFKLCLHTSPRGGSSNDDAPKDGSVDMEDMSLPVNRELPQQPVRSCDELENAVRTGAWLRPDPQSCSFTEYDGSTKDKHNRGRPTGLIRPLKCINIPSCGLRMELLMEISGQ